MKIINTRNFLEKISIDLNTQPNFSSPSMSDSVQSTILDDNVNNNRHDHLWPTPAEVKKRRKRKKRLKHE